MTVTLDRWWAPSEPGIGPDELDLRLLSPGTDKRKDLGAALLGMHRVGAAACEAVATQPMADETVLAQVLAAARGMLAPPAVGAVSKAVGEERYGGLLVRDVLDDAEQAALSLYRSCVARGVAPSTVAKRVGAVYGVPLRELGRYTTLAMDPKANQSALDDLADRTLFGFVSKVVAEEGIDEVVEVSKEEVRTRTRLAPLESLLEQAQQSRQAEWREEDHPRNEEGEFTRRTVSRTTVNRRTVAPRRTVARRTVAAPSERTATARQGSERQGAKRSKSGRKITTQRARLSREAQALQAKTKLALPKHSYAGQEREVPDLLAKRPDPNAGEHKFLHAELSFVLSGDDWTRMKGQMGVARDRYGARQVFRAGGLEEYHGDKPLIHTEEDEDGDDFVTEEHDYAVAHVSELLGVRPEHEVQLPAETRLLPAGSDIEQAKKAFLSEMMGRYGLRNVTMESQFVQEVPDYQFPEMTRLFWQPPTPGKSAADRPAREVVELVLPVEHAYGVDHSHHGADHRDVNLDPNLGLTIDAEEQFYDEKKHVFRTRVYLSATGEDDLEAAMKDRERRKGFGKADTLKAVSTASLESLLEQARASRDWDPEEHPRSAETGEFVRRTTAGRTTVNRRTVSRRTVARQTAERVQLRRTGEARATTERTGSQRKGGQRKGLSREQVQRAVEVAAAQQRALAAHKPGPGDKKAPPVTYFDGEARYYAPSETQLARIFREDLPMETFADLESWTLDGASALMIREQMTDADRGRYDLVEHAATHFFDNLGENVPYDGVFTTVIEQPIKSAADLDQVAYELEDLIFDRNTAEMMSMVLTKDPVDDDWLLTVRLSDDQATPRHLFRTEDANKIRPGAVMRNEGPKRLLNRHGIAGWLRLRYSKAQTMRGGTINDDMPNPITHSWSVSDEP